MIQDGERSHPFWKVLAWAIPFATLLFFGLIANDILSPFPAFSVAVAVVVFACIAGWVHWTYNRLRYIEQLMRHLEARHKWLFDETRSSTKGLEDALQAIWTPSSLDGDDDRRQ